MNRQYALSLTIILFILFLLITYYGAKITFWSSLNLSIFMSLVILLIFYPINQLANDVSDFTLYIYGIFIVLSVITLTIYILRATLYDVRSYL